MTQIYLHPDVEDHFTEYDYRALDAADSSGICRRILADYEGEKVIFLRNTPIQADLELLRSVTFPQVWKYKKYKKMDSAILRRGTLMQFLSRAIASPSKATLKMLGKAMVSTKSPEAVEFCERVFAGDWKACDRFGSEVDKVNNLIRGVMETILTGMRLAKGHFVWRFAETRIENLHFDKEPNSDQEESFRIYVNVDSSPRIWHTTFGLSRLMPNYYRELGLETFRGMPSERLLPELSVRLFGGWQNRGREQFPRHLLMLEPGDVWLSDGRRVPHQVIYGRRVIMGRFVVKNSDLPKDYVPFGSKIAAIHEAAAQYGQRPDKLPAPFPPGGSYTLNKRTKSLKDDWENIHAESISDHLVRL